MESAAAIVCDARANRFVRARLASDPFPRVALAFRLEMPALTREDAHGALYDIVNDQQKKLKDLSGGERNRVHLAKLLKA